MSKSSEQRALEAYPVKMVSGPIGLEEPKFDFNSLFRCVFQDGYEQAEKDLADVAQFSSGLDGFFYGKGYQQAEKDLALSIDDIEKIHVFLYAVKNNKQGVFTFTRLSDEQYEEVLKRFKNLKNK